MVNRRTAELQGRLAQREGRPSTDNPYTVGGCVPRELSEAWRGWEDGYRNESWHIKREKER